MLLMSLMMSLRISLPRAPSSTLMPAYLLGFFKTLWDKGGPQKMGFSGFRGEQQWQIE